MSCRYFKNTDYPLACKWWAQYGWPNIPHGALPDTGIVALNEDAKPVAMAWLSEFSKRLHLLEFFIADKRASKADRESAIYAIIKDAKKVAKDRGAYNIMTMTNHRGLIDKCLKSGYKVSDSNMTHLTCEV